MNKRIKIINQLNIDTYLSHHLVNKVGLESKFFLFWLIIMENKDPFVALYYIVLE